MFRNSTQTDEGEVPIPLVLEFLQVSQSLPLDLDTDGQGSRQLVSGNVSLSDRLTEPPAPSDVRVVSLRGLIPLGVWEGPSVSKRGLEVPPRRSVPRLDRGSKELS